MTPDIRDKLFYIYNSYLFWSNYKCRALVTRKQKKQIKIIYEIKCIFQITVM